MTAMHLLGIKKTPVDPSSLTHRDLLRGEFWQQIPAYKDVTEAQFLDHKWQAKHSITKPKKLLEALKGLVSEAFIEDLARGIHRELPEKMKFARIWGEGRFDGQQVHRTELLHDKDIVEIHE